MIVNETQKPPTGGMGGSVHDWHRGLDPWHEDAFPGDTPKPDRLSKGQRKGGWYALDAYGNEIGFVADGEYIAEKIRIKKSPTADTRSCDWSKVSKEQLCDSSEQDVEKGCNMFAEMLVFAGTRHDWDKLTDIDGFHRDFRTGFEKTTWWDNHRKVNRHHLLQDDGVPEDVNLVDVIEMIVDCTVAGMARTGEVYPLELKPEVLQRAFENTAALMLKRVEIVEEGVANA
jgi:hypothetical protein